MVVLYLLVLYNIDIVGDAVVFVTLQFYGDSGFVVSGGVSKSRRHGNQHTRQISALLHNSADFYQSL